MMAISIFYNIGPTPLAERGPAVSYRLWANVALQPIANVHYDVGPT